MKEDYYFINENILKEVMKDETDDRGHIIFNSQRESDMGRLNRLLINEDRIFVEFNYYEWGPVMSMIYSISDGKKHLIAGRQYIAAKILQVLEEKYPRLKEYQGSKNLEVFKQGNLELYNEKEKALYDLDDLREMLTSEEICIDRIHFIIRSIGSPVLFNALAILLSDDTPFKVSIYISESSFPQRDLHSTVNEWYSEIYSYTSFNRGKKGELSQKKVSSQQEKKRRVRSSQDKVQL